MKKTITNQFCLKILNLGVRHGKALANTVMALASYKTDSVVTLSESPLCHYQYSSLYDAISHLSSDESSGLAIERQIQELCMSQLWEASSEPMVLQTDVTPKKKPHSPTLKDRFLVHIPNCKVPGQRGLDVGLEDSFVNLCSPSGGWSLPVSSRPIPLDQTGSEVGARQVKDLFANKQLPFNATPLAINTLDSGYSATYLDGVKDIENLVSIVRQRKGSKVYLPARPEDSIEGKTPKVYGKRYYLILKSGWQHFKKHPRTKEPYKIWRDAITEVTPSDQTAYEHTLANGRRVNMQLRRWDNLLVRTKLGVPMDDKPFDLLLIQTFDAQSQKPVFKTPMFVAAFGKKRVELSCRQIQGSYRKRYGIEGFFRFVKRNMSLEKYQSSSNQYLQNWIYIIMLAVWLLFSARKIVKNRPKKWQKYKAVEKKKPGEELSMAQTYKAIDSYLLTFDQQPFLPRKSKPGPGRKKGDKQIQRTKYPYYKKNTENKQKTNTRAP